MSELIQWPQTLPSLYRLTLQLGWSTSDWRRAHAAHQMLTPVYSGWVRGSGRPFMAHLIGTAGLCVLEAAPVDEVLAALCHALFEHGAYGRYGSLPPSAAAGAFAAVLPPPALDLVKSYHQFDWRRACSEGQSLSNVDPRILRMRVANEIDDAQDLPFLSDKSRAEGVRELEVCVKLSDAHGWQKLGAAARAAVTDAAALPQAVNEAQSGSFFVIPPGYARTFTGRLRKRLARRNHA